MFPWAAPTFSYFVLSSDASGTLHPIESHLCSFSSYTPRLYIFIPFPTHFQNPSSLTPIHTIQHSKTAHNVTSLPQASLLRGPGSHRLRRREAAPPPPRKFLPVLVHVDADVEALSPKGAVAAADAGGKGRVDPRIVSDATIGLADGLTVPFALTAGLSALGDTRVVIYGGFAELIAGALSMGLGGYLGAKSEM